MWMSLRSHMMCFEGMGRLMEGKKKKNPIRLYSTLILSFSLWLLRPCVCSRACVCSVLMHSPHSLVFQPYVGQDRVK